MMKRNAIAKVTAVAVLAVLIVGGAVGIYFYTSAPSTNPTTTASSSTASSSTSQAGPAGGSQGTDGKPLGAWADYLGYIPAGYVLAPHYPGAAVYPSPSRLPCVARRLVR
jgi:hypothetical protein